VFQLIAPQSLRGAGAVRHGAARGKLPGERPLLERTRGGRCATGREPRSRGVGLLGTVRGRACRRRVWCWGASAAQRGHHAAVIHVLSGCSRVSRLKNRACKACFACCAAAVDHPHENGRQTEAMHMVKAARSPLNRIWVMTVQVTAPPAKCSCAGTRSACESTAG